MNRVYYSPDLDKFAIRAECGPRVTGSHPFPHPFYKWPGKNWFRVCELGLELMDELVERAFSNTTVNNDTLGKAILQRNRMCRCLESEGSSEGMRQILFMPWDDLGTVPEAIMRKRS